MLNLQGYVFDNLEVDENGAARVLTRKVLDDFITDAESSAIVGTPGRIDASVMGYFRRASLEGHYRVRLRSKHCHQRNCQTP